MKFASVEVCSSSDSVRVEGPLRFRNKSLPDQKMVLVLLHFFDLPSAPSISHTPEGAEAATPLGAPVDAGPSSNISSQGATGSSEIFPRKAPFSRGRLRLLSLRSMEEPRMAPPVKERFPILKHILSFMKDMVINES
ncbi:hypothetical protein M9458_011693, partial [Cirrhinus mrigala]